MSEDLFSAGFAWGDGVADVATPVATLGASDVDDVFGGAGDGLCRSVSQPSVALSATPHATSKTEDLRGFPDSGVASVAGVAGVADYGRPPVLSHSVATRAATPALHVRREVQTPPAVAVASVASVAEWLKGLALMEAARPGPKMAHGNWRQIIRDGRAFVEKHGEAVIAAGWTTLDVFGTNSDARHHRVDRLGLLICVRGRQVMGVSATRAVIGSGPQMTTFDRRLRAEGAVPVWDLSEGFWQ